MKLNTVARNVVRHDATCYATTFDHSRYGSGCKCKPVDSDYFSGPTAMDEATAFASNYHGAVVVDIGEPDRFGGRTSTIVRVDREVRS